VCITNDIVQLGSFKPITNFWGRYQVTGATFSDLRCLRDEGDLLICGWFFLQPVNEKAVFTIPTAWNESRSHPLISEMLEYPVQYVRQTICEHAPRL